MSDKQVVLAVFDDEAAADGAAKNLESWAKSSNGVKLNAVGVLVMDDKGKVKTHKLGPRSTGKGAGIGLVLAMLTPVGLGVSVIGGGLLGRLHHKGLGLSEEDRDHISDELKQGHAVVGVLAEPLDAPVIIDNLNKAGGRLETHAASETALEEAAKAEE